MCVTPELLIWFGFMCVSCSGIKQSRSMPVLGCARPPGVLCPPHPAELSLLAVEVLKVSLCCELSDIKTITTFFILNLDINNVVILWVQHILSCLHSCKTFDIF